MSRQFALVVALAGVALAAPAIGGDGACGVFDSSAPEEYRPCVWVVAEADSVCGFYDSWAPEEYRPCPEGEEPVEWLPDDENCPAGQSLVPSGDRYVCWEHDPDVGLPPLDHAAPDWPGAVEQLDAHGWPLGTEYKPLPFSSTPGVVVGQAVGGQALVSAPWLAAALVLLIAWAAVRDWGEG